MIPPSTASDAGRTSAGPLPTALRNTGKFAAATVTLADEGARVRRLTRLLFGTIWMVPGLISGLSVWGSLRGGSAAIPLGTALLWQMSCWIMWAIWAQGILTLAERTELVNGRFAKWFAMHLAASLVVMLVSAVIVGWLDWLFWPWNDVRPPLSEAITRNAAQHLDFHFITYWAFLGAAYTAEFVRRYRERDRAATELQQRLSRQQLEALRMQLNPHFLFNALNSVTELMEDDVRSAQRALTHVSDLLRRSLQHAASPTIPLWREIELVELYLQVARVRYGDGLSVDMHVDPAASDIEVPSFVLQPLVENALKHGLWPGRSGQSMLISARRRGAMLELLVRDNGRGLDGSITDSGRFLAVTPSVDGLGIGLTNTRTRLALLYGDHYAFRMSNAPDGGCSVEIRLPVHPPKS